MEAREAAQLAKLNGDSLGRVLQTRPTFTVRSMKPLTEPQEPELHTSKRQRLHDMETRSMVSL